MQDFGMSYSDYGIKGKGKNEGKGKDKAQGKKPSGKGWGNSRKGEIFERLDQEGKGNKTSRAKPYQPYSKKEIRPRLLPNLKTECMVHNQGL